MTDKERDIDEWLDEQDLDRLETERVMNDLLPLDRDEKIKVGRVHKNTDLIQEHLANERH